VEIKNNLVLLFLGCLIVCEGQGGQNSLHKIAVLGVGYVGLVSGAGLAEIGNTVICADVDDLKIASLNQ